MKTELENKLFDTYPEIFKDKDLPMAQTCMCWGIECNDGWFELLDDLCKKVTCISKHTGIIMKAQQVKEKYGTLRFYFMTDVEDKKVPDEDLSIFCNIIDSLVDSAEVKSGSTCQDCGSMWGKLRGTGWVVTLCDACDEKRNKAKKQ
jgi:hypothetical protein